MTQEISPLQLNERIAAGERIQIIDVRSPGEFASGHLPGAPNVPLHRIQSGLTNVETDAPLVLVCQGGVRSKIACEKVLAQYPALFSLTGGTDGWISLGLSVETAPHTKWSLDRQAHLIAGLILLTSVTLFTLMNPAWAYLCLLPATGLLLDAVTGTCLMRNLLSYLPWNRNS